MFFECSLAQKLWKHLSSYLEEHLILSQLSLRTAFFGFLNLSSNLGLIQNHILLIFKVYLYKSKCERVTLTQIWVGFLGVRFEVEGDSGIRIMLETSNLARKYISICSFRNIPFSA